MIAWPALAGIVGGALACFGWHFFRLRAERSRLRVRLEDAMRNLQRLQAAFTRFAPQEVVERLASGDNPAAEKREVTVLFADLVGFTPLSESVGPDVLLRILNGYFKRMNRVIVEHRGHIAALVGDGIFALFGALEPNPWQSHDAAHAALAMRAQLAAYNQELAAEGLPRLSLGVGLHRGTGVAGLVGSPEIMEFTVVGRTVNLAARVEDLTRVHHEDILLTAAVQAALDSRFVLRELPACEVRGIADPVVTFALERFEESATAPAS